MSPRSRSLSSAFFSRTWAASVIVFTSSSQYSFKEACKTCYVIIQINSRRGNYYSCISCMRNEQVRFAMISIPTHLAWNLKNYNNYLFSLFVLFLNFSNLSSQLFIVFSRLEKSNSLSILLYTSSNVISVWQPRHCRPF